MQRLGKFFSPASEWARERGADPPPVPRAWDLDKTLSPTQLPQSALHGGAVERDRPRAVHHAHLASRTTPRRRGPVRSRRPRRSRPVARTGKGHPVTTCTRPAADIACTPAPSALVRRSPTSWTASAAASLPTRRPLPRRASETHSPLLLTADLPAGRALGARCRRSARPDL